MASEPNLRDLFRGDTRSLPEIDAATVIRRSKRRRLPAQVGVGGAFVLAIGGLGVAGLQGFGRTDSVSTLSTTSSDEAPAHSGDDRGVESAQGLVEGDGTAIKRAPADRINLCGAPLADVAPNDSGLVLSVSFPDSPAGSTPVMGTATLTNTGTQAVAGYMAPTPAITLSQAGTVLWHSNGPTIMSIRDVSLAPGESLELAASFTPVACAVEDDTAEAFRTDLPPVAAGEYQLSAAADVTVGDTAVLVTGPAQTVRIG
jgi:hypothetical protein